MKKMTLEELTQRYLELEKDWTDINAEMELLKTQIKQAMKEQDIKKTSVFELSTYQRHTIKTSLLSLAELVLEHDLDIELILSKEIQKELGAALLEKLNVSIESTEVVSLKRK